MRKAAIVVGMFALLPLLLLLIFIDDSKPEYVPWEDVEQVDFDRPPAMYPALSGL